MSTKVQKAINKIQYKDDQLPFIQYFYYSQIFDYLRFYVENNTKNQQVKQVIKYIYENDYIDGEGIGRIRDLEKEAIIMDKENIKMLITKEEIDKVKSIFSGIKDFEKDCEMKTWEE